MNAGNSRDYGLVVGANSPFRSAPIPAWVSSQSEADIDRNVQFLL
jgi:hypothetical protein